MNLVRLFSAISGLALLTTMLPAQTPTPRANPALEDALVAPLWTGDAPGAVGKTDADVPKLYCYAATGPGPHTAVVVLPGGGYNHLVLDKEGTVEAQWLNTLNISACVLQYRLSPRYLYPWALVDGQRAVRVVRAHAKDWGINPNAIGVWGFSAGGHMAGFLETADPRADLQGFGKLSAGTFTHDEVDKVSAHPDFAIINYGRLDLDPAIPGTHGMEALTGPNAPRALVDVLNPVLHVTKATSPTFLYATERDEKVNSLNATSFFNALQKAGVPAELHIFELGPHGTHMGTDQPKFPELALYPLLLQHWLQLHGWIPTNTP